MEHPPPPGTSSPLFSFACASWAARVVISSWSSGRLTTGPPPTLTASGFGCVATTPASTSRYLFLPPTMMAQVVVLPPKLPVHPFPEFTGIMIIEKPDPWNWGASSSENTRIDKACLAIKWRRDHGMNVVAVVGEYHRRRFMPLMAQILPMWRV